MYKIKKAFHLAYGHRLPDHKGKCRNLHGHNAVVEVTLAAAGLNDEMMVMDFAELGLKMKTWLDDNLDHKMILAKADPLARVLREQGQACYLTDGSPTAEALARLIYETAESMALPVRKVAFWETPTSMASYKK
ncbi:MAG TPA: 6-pyruvoyl tetrahydrobiopterin synthase [Elusimicrobia bacterium]|nr:6-pyruvoyl tetrahydrobiopterin synthase [Elusimicrobiota bacterium]